MNKYIYIYIFYYLYDIWGVKSAKTQYLPTGSDLLTFVNYVYN